MVNFVNADLIVGGLSPLKPQLAAMAAARMVLREIDRLAAEISDFAFETTLSGLNSAAASSLEAFWLPRRDRISAIAEHPASAAADSGSRPARCP